MVTDKPIVPYEDPQWIPTQPAHWNAEYDGEVAGSIERTSPSRYRAINRHGKKIGTFRTLDQARLRLTESNSATRIQRLDQSRILRFTGLAMLTATLVIAAIGLVILFNH